MTETADDLAVPTTEIPVLTFKALGEHPELLAAQDEAIEGILEAGNLEEFVPDEMVVAAALVLGEEAGAAAGGAAATASVRGTSQISACAASPSHSIAYSRASMVDGTSPPAAGVAEMVTDVPDSEVLLAVETPGSSSSASRPPAASSVCKLSYPARSRKARLA